jgi:hypothetical protein
LYLRLPEYFKIILRGKEVERHCIAADLIYPECISYKPQACGGREVCIVKKNIFYRPHHIVCSRTNLVNTDVNSLIFLFFLLHPFYISGGGFDEHRVFKRQSNY